MYRNHLIIKFLAIGLFAGVPVAHAKNKLKSEIHLNTFINAGNLAALEQALGQNSELSKSEQIKLKANLLAYTTSLRNQKMALLITNKAKSRTVAAVKAVASGTLALLIASAMKRMSETLNRKAEYFSTTIEAGEAGKLGLIDNCINFFTDRYYSVEGMTAQLAGDEETLTRTLIIAAPIMPALASTAYCFENASFAFYGTHYLVQEIENLDNIISYLTQGK